MWAKFFLNEEMVGFINREGLIQEKSEEKNCLNELETFLSRDAHDIFRINNVVSVKIKNKNEKIVEKLTEYKRVFQKRLY
jgi:hypothetical protein